MVGTLEAPVNGLRTTLASPYITSTAQTTVGLSSATGWTVGDRVHVRLTDGVNTEIAYGYLSLGTTFTFITRAAESFAGVAIPFTFGSGSTIDIVTSVESVRALIKNYIPHFYLDDPAYATSGAVGVGNTAADTAAMTNCANAMIANGSGLMVAGGKKYQISTWPTFAATTVALYYGVRGQGAGITVFESYASSLANSLTVNAPSDFVTGAPQWSGFTIDGTNATNTAVGLAWSDVSYGSFEDIIISDFTLSDAMYFLNVVGWCEGIAMRSVVLNNNANALHFAVGSAGFSSFDYWNIDGLYMNLNANQNGIVEEASLNTGGTNPLQTLHEGSKVRLVANCQTGATNTGKLFWFKGWSAWANTTWDVNAEVDGSTVAHTSFVFGHNNATIGGVGLINLLGTFQSPTFTGGTYQWQITGHVVVSGLFSQTASFQVAPGGINRQVTGYPTPPALASGAPWHNTTGSDVLLVIPCILTAASATIQMIVQYYTITAAGPTVGAAPASGGMTIPVTVFVPDGSYLRIDLSAGSFGTIRASQV